MTWVIAPGKLVLTGAYAVLEGAPALVMAVNRYARVDTSRTSNHVTREVKEALGDDAPHWEADELYEGETKLGLGSSAAILVASLAAREVARGATLDDPDVRSRIFARARDAHAAAQGGGSGVDVAASTYGGVLRYSLKGGRPWVLEAALPQDLVLTAFFSGASARTSDLLAQVAALRASDVEGYHARMANLGDASEAAIDHVAGGSVREIVASVRRFGAALEELGEAADCDIVPLSFRRLAVVAAEEGAAFVPSGAGGGDLGVHFAAGKPSERFRARAAELGMKELDLDMDGGGVRVSEVTSRSER